MAIGPGNQVDEKAVGSTKEQDKHGAEFKDGEGTAAQSMGGSTLTKRPNSGVPKMIARDSTSKDRIKVKVTTVDRGGKPSKPSKRPTCGPIAVQEGLTNNHD